MMMQFVNANKFSLVKKLLFYSSEVRIPYGIEYE